MTWNFVNEFLIPCFRIDFQSCMFSWTLTLTLKKVLNLGSADQKFPGWGGKHYLLLSAIVLLNLSYQGLIVSPLLHWGPTVRRPGVTCISWQHIQLQGLLPQVSRHLYNILNNKRSIGWWPRDMCREILGPGSFQSRVSHWSAPESNASTNPTGIPRGWAWDGT